MGTPRGASDDAHLDTKIQALPPHGNESNTEHDSAKKSHHELNLNSISTDKTNHIVVEKPKVIFTASELPPMQLTNVTGVSDISSEAMNVSPQADTNRAADAFKSLLNAVASFVDKTGNTPPELQQHIAPSPFLVAAAGDSSQQSSLLDAQSSGATSGLPNKFVFSPVASVSPTTDAVSLPDLSAIQTTTFMAPVIAAQSSGLDHKDLISKRPEFKTGLTPASILLTDALTGQPQNIAVDNHALSMTGSPALSPDLSINTRDTSLKKVEPIYTPSAALLADAASAALPKVAVDVHEAPLPPTLAPTQVAALLSRSATGTGERANVSEPLTQVALPQVSARAAATFASIAQAAVTEVKEPSVKKQEAVFTPASVLLADAVSSAAPKITTDAHDALLTPPDPVPIAAILSQTAAVTTDKINIVAPVHPVALPQVSARATSAFASTTQDAGAELKDANFKKPETIYAPSSILLADAAPPTMPKIVAEVRDALPPTIPAVQVATLLSRIATASSEKSNVVDPPPQVALPQVSARTASTFASTAPDLVADLKEVSVKKQETIYTPAAVLLADAAPPAVLKISNDVRDALPVPSPPVQIAAALSQSANSTGDKLNVTDPPPQVALPQVSARTASTFASTAPDLVADLKEVSVKKQETIYTPAAVLLADAAPPAVLKISTDVRDALPVPSPPVQIAAALSQSANGTGDKLNVANPPPQVALPQVSARTASTFASMAPDLVADLKEVSVKKQETIYTPAAVLLADASPTAIPKISTEVRDALPTASPPVQIAAALSQAANGNSDKTYVAEQTPQVALPQISARAASTFASATPDLVADLKEVSVKKQETIYTPAAVLLADAAPPAGPKISTEVRDALPAASPPAQIAAALSQAAYGNGDKTNIADSTPQVALPQISARAASTFASTTPDLVADLKDVSVKKTDINFTPAPILVADAAPIVLPKVAADGRDALPVATPTVQVAALLSQVANGNADKTNVADPVPQVALPQVSARAASTFASTNQDSVADNKDATFKKPDTNYTPAPILVADAAPIVQPKVAADGRDALPVATPTVQVAALLSQAANGNGDKTNVTDPAPQVALPQVSARAVSTFASTTQEIAPPVAPIAAPPIAATLLVADAAKPPANNADQVNQNKNLSNSADASQFNGRYVGPGTTNVIAEQSAQPIITLRSFSSGLARDAVEPNLLLTADAGNNGKQFFALPGSAAQVKGVIADGPISGSAGPLTKLIDTTTGVSAAESFKQLIGRQLQAEPTVAALAADALKLVIARQLGTELGGELTGIKPLVSPADKAATPNQILVGANQILVNGGSIDNRLSDPRLGADLGPNSARSPLTISGPLDSLNPTATTKGILTASVETTITGSLVSTGIKTGTAADAHIAQSINIMVGIGTGVTIGADGKPIAATDGKTSPTDSRVPTASIPLPSEITSTIKGGDTTTATTLTGKEIKLSDLTDISGIKKGESTKVGDGASGTGESATRVTIRAGDKKDSKEEDEEVIKNAGTMAGAGGFGGGAANPTTDPNNAQTSSNALTGTIIDPDQKMTLPNLEIVDGRILVAGQKNTDNDSINSGIGVNASTRGEIETGIESDGPHSRKDEVSGVTTNPTLNNPTGDSQLSEIDRLFGVRKTQPSDEEVAWQAGQRQTELLSFERRRLYRIKRGDSLADIARRELGNVTYVQLLIELNIDTLTFDRNGQIVLAAGRDIYLPSRADMLRFLAYQEQENKLLLAFTDGKNIDTNHQVVYACRLGDTLATVAKRHPAVRDARLWKLVAELNNLSTQKDKNGAPVARLQRGQHLLLPTAEQKSDYLHELAFGTKSKDLSHDFVRHIADDKVPEPVPKTSLKDKAFTVEPDTSFKSRLVSQSDLGDTGDSLVLRLELKIEGKFVPVVEYSIGFGSATLRVHTKNGDSKVTNIDLPNRSARELAESDLAANSNMYCQNFENNILPM